MDKLRYFKIADRSINFSIHKSFRKYSGVWSLLRNCLQGLPDQ